MALEGLFKVVNIEQISMAGTEYDLNPSGVERLHRMSMFLNKPSSKHRS